MIKYEQICEVTSNDTDKTVTAEIISFSPTNACQQSKSC